MNATGKKSDVVKITTPVELDVRITARVNREGHVQILGAFIDLDAVTAIQISQFVAGRVHSGRKLEKLDANILPLLKEQKELIPQLTQEVYEKYLARATQDDPA